VEDVYEMIQGMLAPEAACKGHGFRLINKNFKKHTNYSTAISRVGILTEKPHPNQKKFSRSDQ